MPQIKIGDVARAAGVSNSTVSRVLKGQKEHMRPETRNRVLRAIEELGFRPNQLARGLVTGKTNTIGVIIPDVSNPFFGTAIKSCEDVLFDNGYNIILCNTNENVDREKQYLDLLISRSVDALAIWGSRIPGDELTALVGDSIPLLTVEFSDEPSAPNHICINIDNEDGAKAATQHLIEQGRRRIAHLSGPVGRITGQRRFSGYQKALEENGLEYDPLLVLKGKPSIRGGYQAVLDILKNQSPDAVFCYNDLMAVGAIIAAQQNNLQVPNDLAIVGFDDITLASLVTPPLTTIQIPQRELGSLTGKLLLQSLQDGELLERSILLPVKLQVRASSVTQPFTSEQRHALLENLISYTASDQTDKAHSATGDLSTG